MTASRLLVAEDDPGLRSVLVRGLAEQGYAVDAAARGDDALEMVSSNEYAVAVVDWRMPGLTGLEVVERTRRLARPTAILMLTARDAPGDRIEGLDAGADDYVIKPFDLDEVYARVRALLRRPRGGPATVLRLARIELEPDARTAAAGGDPLALTTTEFAILELLLRAHPGVVERREISRGVWRSEAGTIASNTIDVHVARLRAKLTGSGARIVGVRGRGYRIVAT